MIVAGIDVGSRHDRTALVVLEDDKVALLAQPPSGMTLSTQAAFLAPLVADAELVCVDATGLGLGLGEALNPPSGHVLLVTFVAGDKITSFASNNVLNVRAGKAWLVQRLAVTIHRRELAIPATKLGLELVRQLENMKARVTSGRCVKYEAPGVAADDLAMALALAVLAQDIVRKHIADKKSARHPQQ